MLDDKIHAEIKALLDKVLAIDSHGNRLLDDTDLHPMTRKLEELVSINAVEIAYEYIVSDALLEIELKRKGKQKDRSVLTVKQSTDMLGASTQSIRNLISSGKLKAIEIGTGT